MKTGGIFWAISLALIMFMAAGCAPAATPAATQAPAATEAPAAREAPAATEAPAAQPVAASTALSNETALSAPPIQSGGGQGAQRLIIKNADLRLLVDDTETSIDRLTQVVDDMGGYIISTRKWINEQYDTNYEYATYTIGVPSDQFEQTLRRLRGICVQVLDENATGEDVSDEYVDLKSKLENLEATRDRVRKFLDDAKTVDEALKVNQQLAKIEEEINTIQGRMNYLFDRAAYSTITVTLEPVIIVPTITPTGTPTITSTPLPTITPTPWQPGKTLNQAVGTLGNISRGAVDAFLWFVVVLLPVLLILAAIIFGVLWLLRKLRRLFAGQRNPPAAPPPEVSDQEVNRL